MNAMKKIAALALSLGAFATGAFAASAMPMGKHHAQMKCEACHTPQNAVKGNGLRSVIHCHISSL